MELAPGTRLGGYEILSPLGSGGMGEVWKARDTRLSRPVAIKILKDKYGQDALKRLMQEARTAAQLNHPNIVTIHEIAEHDGLLYIVMEWIAGKPLSDRIPRKGLPVNECLRYAISVVRALEAAHLSGIIHRDLKPSNVMIAEGGEVKLLDFGLAKVLEPAAEAGEEVATKTVHSSPLTERGQILGTVAYMSPEQAQGKPVDHRTDLFSFGTMLYEMLSGRRPFDGENNLSTLGAILHKDPAPPSTTSGPNISVEVGHIVLRCLRKDPDRRFQSAADLRAALEDVQDREKIGNGDAGFRGPRPLWIVLGAGVAGLALALWLWTRANSSGGNTAGANGIRQITFDPGIAAWPSVSPDGKLLAFASDRGEAGNLDIWVRQVAGGGLVRLTTQPGADLNPQFSPDGTRVFYLGGDSNIYDAPALGGPTRRVIENAGPFSVSSRGEIVFVRYPIGSRTGSIFILPIGGGTPGPWGKPCKSFSRLAWSPDGRQLFFRGDCGSNLNGWILAPRSGAAPKLLMESTTNLNWETGAWVGPPRQGVVFPRGADNAIQLFRSDLKHPPFAITTGGASPFWPAVGPDGTTIFSAVELMNTVHGVTLDKSGMPVGAPSETAAAMGHFGVDRNGRTLVYGRLVGKDEGELVVRTMVSGEEKVFASHQLLGVHIGSLWPQASPDGTQVFYRVVGVEGGHYLLRVDTGEVKRVATMKEFTLGSDWSPDGKSVIGECPAPGNGICEWNAASGKIRELASIPKQQLLYPSWSWDGRFIVFMRRTPGSPTGIWASPVRPDGMFASEGQWTELSEPGTENSRPRFSPDASLVYYVTARLGQRVLVARKLDRAMRPVGDPLTPLRQPLEIPLIRGGFGPYPLIVVTRERLYYSTIGMRGNLWAMQLD